MRRPPEPSGGGVVAFAVLLALLAGAGFVWLWGGVAGCAFGSGWPRVPLPALLSVPARLPEHLADPAAAWPKPGRAALPGPAGVYVALAAVVAGSGLIAVGLARHWPWRRGARDGGARWASTRELAVLFSRPGGRGGHGGRLVLGRYRGRLLRAEQRHALVAFGPPQSGKSAGLAIPALLEWDGPAIASSIKTDLLGATFARRAAIGDAMVFDPFGLTAVPTQTWSPLRSAATWDGALEVSRRLASAGELDQRGVEGGDFWAIAAEQRIAPLLYAGARAGGGMADVTRWAYGHGARELDAVLDRAAREAGNAAERADAQAAYESARSFDAQAERTRSSIEGTVQALLRAYRQRRVLAASAGCEITADRLLDGPGTLFLIGDAKANRMLRPIFLALLGEIVDRAYERANLAGGRLDRPLLLCLDEAGNVAPLPNLAEIASTAPSHNIQLVSIFHDLEQARARYGGQASTVVNSHRARMLLPGVADLETLRYFSGLVGDEEARDSSRTSGAGGASRTVARRRRPLLAAEALRQLPDGSALLLYGRLPPATVRLRRWFEDRRLRRLAGGAA